MSQVVARRRALAPAPGGSSGARRNWSTNPSFESDVANWATSDALSVVAGATLARVTSDAKFGSACGEVSTDGVSTQQGISQTIVQSFVAGQQYVLSMWLRTLAGSAAVAVQLGASGSDRSSQGDTITTAWTNVATIWTPIGSHASAFAEVYTLGAQAVLWHVDGVLVEPRSTPGAYGDGSSPGWHWNGTVNDSTSQNF